MLRRHVEIEIHVDELKKKAVEEAAAQVQSEKERARAEKRSWRRIVMEKLGLVEPSDPDRPPAVVLPGVHFQPVRARVIHSPPSVPVPSRPWAAVKAEKKAARSAKKGGRS